MTAMFTNVRSLVILSLSLVCGVSLLWTLTHLNKGRQLIDGLFAAPMINPSESSSSSPIFVAGLNNWTDEDVELPSPEKVVQRPVFDHPPLDFSTEGDGKVVVLLGLTTESLSTFSEVQNFHQKLFYNRFDYATQLGASLSARLMKATSSCRSTSGNIISLPIIHWYGENSKPL
jgi:hypothetical protein